MKAMLLCDYRQLEIRDLPAPTCGSGEVLVRIHACGICGSDIHGFDGSSGRRIPPLVMGHEAAGVVAEVGKEVADLEAGDRVTFDSMVSCGRCAYCQRGQANLCDDRRVLGVSCGDYRKDGCFAEYVAVPRHIVYRVPEELPLEHAAMVEPVSVAVHAVGRADLQAGSRAVVVGCGMIGLLCVQVLRALGCERVLAVDVDDARLELAGQLGAEAGFNPRSTDVIQEICSRTEGRGADRVIEAVGASDSVAMAIACTGKGGRVVLVGNIAAQVDLPLQDVVTRELSVVGSCGCSGEYPQCIDLMTRGQVRVEPLISRLAPLEQGPELFDRLYQGDSGLMKVMLQP
ncbi:MAG: galactitol-1-phosphate 5-dehydrogenase [Phycisphaerae bacterium]|nr:galactitol-1-phosphate 5-dehydrogenase [Phycisphaerae bacterium]